MGELRNGDQPETTAEDGQVDLPGTWCPRCGEPTHAVPTHAGRSSAHDRCEAALRLEPPRYCHRCRRRMVVQVVPRGWEARCSQHGVVAVSS